jgi:hypothetical protein
MSAILNLSCWLVGDDATSIFQAEFVNTRSVATLKDAIKEKKKPVLDHIPADSLRLWRCSIPVDRDLQKRLASLDLADESQLSSVDDLLEIFPELPPRKHLHIIVNTSIGE